MYMIRDVFRCKPGKSRAVAEKFKATVASLEAMDGFYNCRVLLDFVADYWTVVLQAEVPDLRTFEEHMASFSARPEIKEKLAGYLDMVDGGRREIYRIV